jgi:branched-chain amino acid transport system ATP-binding protein
MEARTEAVLAAVGLRKRFGALAVLDGVDLSLRGGEAVGIVGPNGAGKTTLLNVLSGALAPDGGTVEFRGRDVTARGAAERCKLGIARTHQVPRPFVGMTVFENVLVGATAAGRRRGSEAYDLCLQVLDQTGLGHLANRRAEGLGLLQRKRLELARALAVEPAALLLDEIGGGLTDAESEALVETVASLRDRGIAVLWIEHIVHVLLQVVGRLVCMDEGRIIAEGEPEAVVAQAAVIDAYLGSGGGRA